MMANGEGLRAVDVPGFSGQDCVVLTTLSYIA